MGESQDTEAAQGREGGKEKKRKAKKREERQKEERKERERGREHTAYGLLREKS